MLRLAVDGFEKKCTKNETGRVKQDSGTTTSERSNVEERLLQGKGSVLEDTHFTAKIGKENEPGATM